MWPMPPGHLDGTSNGGVRSRSMRGTFFLLAAFLLVLASGESRADSCGDDVDGQRIACRCGDVAVSDTALRAEDPIVRIRCSLDGLRVRASAEAASIRIDLAGFTLHGSGVGTGIQVLHGGTDGAFIVGSGPGNYGVIDGFGTGLATSRHEGVARVVRLELRNNVQDGVRMAIAGTVLEDVVAHANQGDGLYLRGSGGRLVAVHSYENLANGLRLFTSNAIVGALAEQNGRSGIVVDGHDNDLSNAQSIDNGRIGVVSRNSRRRPTVGRAEGNRQKDTRLSGLPRIAERTTP